MHASAAPIPGVIGSPRKSAPQSTPNTGMTYVTVEAFTAPKVDTYQTVRYGCDMAGRELWLDEGLKALAEDGAPGVTIEKLSARVGLSKGSFYHHFTGMPGFKTALMAHFEVEHTTRFIDAVEGEGAASPREKIEELIAMVLSEQPLAGAPDVEVAMRAWAQQDPDVRAAQHRVDQIRIGYIRDLWLALSGDAGDASRMGQLLYLMLIGAGYVIPPLPANELRQLYDLVLRLAPTDNRSARPQPTKPRRNR